jgi:hypothetical protein
MAIRHDKSGSASQISRKSRSSDSEGVTECIHSRQWRDVNYRCLAFFFRHTDCCPLASPPRSWFTVDRFWARWADWSGTGDDPHTSSVFLSSGRPPYAQTVAPFTVGSYLGHLSNVFDIGAALAGPHEWHAREVVSKLRRRASR